MTAEKRRSLESNLQVRRTRLQEEHDAAVRELQQRGISRQAWEGLTLTTSEHGGFGFCVGYTKTRSRLRPTPTARQLGPQFKRHPRPTTKEDKKKAQKDPLWHFGPNTAWDQISTLAKAKLEKGLAPTIEQARELVGDEYPELYSQASDEDTDRISGHRDINEQLWILAVIAKASQLALRTDDPEFRVELWWAIKYEKAILEDLRQHRLRVARGREGAKDQVEESRRYRKLIKQAYDDVRQALAASLTKPSLRRVLDRQKWTPKSGQRLK